MTSVIDTNRIIPPSSEDTRKITEPPYYQRNYSNDIPIDKSTEKGSWANTAQRVGMTALPFLSLYKPFSFPISLGMGALRTYTCGSQLFASIQSGNTGEIPYQLLQTTIAIIALAGTVFAHPLGMLITTGHDLIMDIVRLMDHLQKGEYQLAMESCLSIINNALYLSLFLHGGLELAIASLAMQILLGLYNSRAEFLKGNYIEAIGHLGMSLVRGNQLAGQAKMLQMKWKLEALMRKATQNEPKGTTQQTLLNVNSSKTDSNAEIDSLDRSREKNNIEYSNLLSRAQSENNQELIEILMKYGNNPHNIPVLHYAVLMNDEKAVSLLVARGANVHQPSSLGTPLEIALKNDYLKVASILLGNNEEIFEILVKYKNNPDNIPILNYAVLVNDDRAVNLLLKAGMNVNQPSSLGTPLEIALKNDYLKTASFLIENQATATSQVVSICCEKRLLETLSLMIKSNPEIVKNDAFINICCETPYLEGLELLFKYGATIPKNFTQNRVLWKLLSTHDPKYLSVIKFMIRQGADCKYTVDFVLEMTERRSVHGSAGLLVPALDFNDYELIELLIKK